jgi:hypothetical protein
LAPIGTPQATTSAEYAKPLTRSDAQRKRTGNQRGSITLTQQQYQIDAQRYFRFDFFGDAVWTTGTTRTGEPREIARVPFDVTFLGEDVGVIELDVSYAPNREASQGNYTTLVHLGGLAPHFVRSDVEGRELKIARADDGTFSLEVT